MKFKLKTFWTSSVLLLIILSIFSIFQTISLVSETKSIQVYEEKLERVKQENENLIVNAARINSLDNIKELIEPFGFVRIGEVHHIKLLGDVVVTR